MSNVGFATLQVLPSLKNLRKHLQRDADPILSAWAKEAGKTIGDGLAASAGQGIADAVGDALKDGADRGADGLGDSVRESVGDSVRDGFRDGFRDSADDAEEAVARPLRRGVTLALRDGFRQGFRSLFSISQDQGGRMRKSLALGVAGGLINGAKEGFDAAMDAAKGFSKFLSDVGRAGGQAAFAGLTTALQGLGTTVATGGLNLLAGALLAVAAAVPAVLTGFTALAPVVLLAGGLFGSLFTIIAGGVGSVGVFALAFRGLGDAFSEVMEKGKATDETLKKLAPNARKFVKAFAGLRKPLSDLRRAVQDKLFDGLDKSLKSLAKSWLPQLKPMLTDLAARFGKFGKTVMSALGKPDFIRNIREAMLGFGAFLDRLGESMDPLIGAFGKLAKAAGPFLATLGDSLAGAFETFSAWIDKAEKSGALSTFFTDAAKALRDIWDIGGLVLGIAKELISTFFPSSKAASDTFLGGVKHWLGEIKAWLADPENKKKIQEFMDKLGEFVKKATTEWLPAVMDFMTKVDGWATRIESWGATVEGWGQRVSGVFATVRAIVSVSVAAMRAAIDTLTYPLDAAIGAFRRLRTGAEGQLRALLGVVSSIPGRILAALGGLGGMLYGVGANIVQGLISGIRDMIPSAASVARSLAGSVRAAAESALGINSPSRVFMKIGGFVAEGMALGIDKGTPRVTKAVTAMTRVPDTARATAGPDWQAAPSAAPSSTAYHLHDSRATIAQLEALQARQAILARAGRAR
ncbi:phage-related protein [Micromonospora sp. M71_S20]|uniref:phage tail protein n=1 Tax=Micromonospora sp. M71_S20 TaxID=592872 RepID=UPI000EACDBB1|nr:hypothetical protein [Micromonospora sp. M71_S20]RLK22643.1 phage-related protein [Micromonospora sp. M71_S20]